jgi:hypothetical protein
LAHAALEELLKNADGSATARAAAARFLLDKVAGSSAGALELAKRALWAEPRQAELPAARAKLDRLIESRAQARAEEMYAERRRLELEAVKAELRVDASAPAPAHATPEEMVDEAAPRIESERRES